MKSSIQMMVPAETGHVRVRNAKVKMQKQRRFILGIKPRFFYTQVKRAKKAIAWKL